MSSEISQPKSDDEGWQSVADLLPSLPLESAVAWAGSATLSVMPKSIREYVSRNLSLKAPVAPVDGDNKMAGPLRLPGSVKAGARAAGKGAVLAKDAALTGLSGLALYQYASENYPEVASAVSDYLSVSGKDPVEMGQEKNNKVQAALIDLLGRFGMPVGAMEQSGLTTKELNLYRAVLDKYRKAGDAAVAANQTKIPSTGSPEMDRIAKNLDIERICNALNVSSETYAALLRGLNSHTPADIEAFQLHRQMYGLRAI